MKVLDPSDLNMKQQVSLPKDPFSEDNADNWQQNIEPHVDHSGSIVSDRIKNEEAQSESLEDQLAKLVSKHEATSKQSAEDQVKIFVTLENSTNEYDQLPD